MNPSPIITDPVQLQQQQQQQKESRTLLNQHEVNKFLTQCGLSQYYNLFIEEGFDRPESLLEVTETDLIQMEVKRGHRRLLQRAIANAKGIPCTVPLNITPIPKPTMTEYNNREEQTNNKKILQPQEAMNVSLQLLAGSNNSPLSSSTTNTSSNSSSSSTLTTNNSPNNSNNIQTSSVNNNNINNDYFPSAGTMTHSAQSGMSSTEEEAVTSDNVHRLWKRKYHRHAKPDTNAPLKPPSAYVMFSNDVRAELKQQNKSFTDLAKIIGDRWKNISAEEKELYETNAMKSREEYLKKIEEYHKTDEYKKYQQYISDFKAENEAASRPVGRPRKRHRRDYYASDGATSDSKKRASSISSQVEELQQQQQQQLQQQQQQLQQQHQRTNSTSLEQRHYPFYLMNEDSATMSEK